MISTALAFIRSQFRLKRMLITGGIISGFFLIVVTGMYLILDVPEPDDFATAQSVRVVDTNGKALGRISAGADRVSISLEDVPEHVQQAVIAIEDRRFRTHSGVRPTSIVRAALKNILARGVSQGGSTITQQYVKNAFVGRERSIVRKMKEAVLSVKLERKKSKDEILEAYLNTIYFGRGAYGIESAARSYFGKPAKRLTLSQGAMIAGAIAAPELSDPIRHPERSEARRELVLKAMVRDGYIDDEESADALKAKPKARIRAAGGRIAPHFLEDVRLELEQRFGASELYHARYAVRVTLDIEMQEAAERAVSELKAPRSHVPDLALVAIDPATGAIRAMVGARDHGTRQLNLARSARQPGSAFKPAVLASALRDGARLGDKITAPGTRTFRLPGGQTWKVSNYDKKGRGTIDLVSATANSVNTVYAALIVEKTDPETVVETARSLGIRTKLDAFYSLALGTEEVTPVELASMYATFAAQGEHHTPYSIERVVGPKGDVFRAEPKADRGLDEEISGQVTLALQQVVRSGTGRGADPGRPAAGKTGTTNGNNDTWFAGYTPDLAAVVWNGYPDGKKTLPSDAFGGRYPAQLWRAFMREALKGKPARSFPPATIGGASPSPSPSESSSPSPSPSVPPVASRTPVPTPSLPQPSPSPSSSPDPSPSPSGSTRPAPKSSPTANGP